MNYFTEIEDKFRQRRGQGLVLSCADWELIQTWKDAGIPMEAVLRGIDNTFDKYERRPNKTRSIHSLAYCTQEVLAAAEDMKEAAVGSHSGPMSEPAGMEPDDIARYLTRNATALRQVDLPAVAAVAEECAASLGEIAANLQAGVRLEDVERRLTVLEEKLLGALTLAATEAELATLLAQADVEIAPYRAKMPSSQITQLQRQFIHKRLFALARIPRLSLFYI